MADPFKTIVLPRAVADIDFIYEWIHSRSPAGARIWLDELEKVFIRLSIEPEVFGPAAEAIALGKPLKQCIFKTRYGRIYRVIFMIDVDNVVVLRVRGPGQPPLTQDEIGSSGT